MALLEVAFIDIRDSNMQEHHTDAYDYRGMIIAEPISVLDQQKVVQKSPSVILRRGERFWLNVRFKRDYNAYSDVVRIKFSFGSDPRPTRGTVVIIKPRFVPEGADWSKNFPRNENLWDAQVTDNRARDEFVVQVYIPPDVPVGVWSCSVETNNDYEGPIDPYYFFILFNPWSPNDAVFLENEDERNEYVLNERGKIWCGTFKNPESRLWTFGQFDRIALPAAVYLLDKSSLLDAKRGNPVWVTRAIAAMVNADDNNGLLVRRIDGNYNDGISPHAWINSASILYKYLQFRGEPVKYGQCWIDSAVVVTICRALGIPCRSTTSYVSSHEIDSPVIGRYLDTSNNTVQNNPTENNDYSWSFHAWNDVWFSRPDLPEGYGGWQIIDGTPLSQRDRLRRFSGPASLTAIRNGEIGYLYDTPLLFCEINANTIHYTRDNNSESGYRKIGTNKYGPGRKIVTKNLGSTDTFGNSDLLNITLDYKYPTKPSEEYKRVIRSISKIPEDLQPLEIKQKDVIFNLLKTKHVHYGDGIDIKVRVQNVSRENRTISYVLSASSVYYTGKFHSSIKRIPSRATIRPDNEKILNVHLTPEVYQEQLVDHGVIKLLAYGLVEETGQAWSEEQDYNLISPDMSIALSSDTCNLNDIFTVIFTFHNPLNISLTDCFYTIEGPTEDHLEPSAFKRKVKPNEVVNEPISLRASRRGKGNIVVTFTSRQIPHITASRIIEIL